MIPAFSLAHLGHSYLLLCQVCLSKAPTVPVPYLSATQRSQSPPSGYRTCPITAPIPTWAQIQASLPQGSPSPISQSSHFLSPPDFPLQSLHTSSSPQHVSLYFLSPTNLLYLTCPLPLLLSFIPGPSPGTLIQLMNSPSQPTLQHRASQFPTKGG